MKKLLVIMIFASSVMAQTLPEAPKPKFFNKTSNIEMSLAAVTIAGDGFSTRRLSGYYLDYNPLANTMAKSNTGTVVYFGASYGAFMGVNYFLKNHPRARHIFNWTVIGTESYWTIHNSFKTIRTANKPLIKSTNCPSGFICATAY